MVIIEEYKIQPIFSDTDYITQAHILRDKIMADRANLPTRVENDEDKWACRNFFRNIYTYWYFVLQHIYTQALVASISGNTENEQYGWFIYPRTERIKLADGYKYKTVDSYNTAIYTKYFNKYFEFALYDNLINEYYDEAKLCYQNKRYYSCVCALFPIIESYTRILSAYSEAEDGKFTQFKALNKVLSNIPRWAGAPSVSIDKFIDEYTKIKNFMLENYYKKSFQDDAEPKFICRNRLLHGIITRQVSASDCLKLFLILRSFVHLDEVFSVAHKLIKYNVYVLKLEDSLCFGSQVDDSMYKDFIKD